MRTIGLGVLGCGFVGAAYARLAAQHADVSVRAVAGGAGSSARTLATELRCGCEADAADLISRRDIDAIVVATPSYLHGAHALLAATHGKHVFMEPPMALSLRECDALMRALDRSGTTCMLGALLHYYAGIRRAKTLIESGGIGRPYVASAAHTSWAARPLGGWKGRRAATGGHLFHHIHEIDLFRWYVGDVATVFARTRSFGDPDRDDVVLVTLEFENGALGVIEHGHGFRINARGVTVNGSHGAVCVDTRDATVLYRREGVPDETFPLSADPEANRSMRALFSGANTAYGKPGLRPWPFLTSVFRMELADFITCLLGDPAPPDARWLLDPHHGREAVAVAEAAMTSARDGAAVKLRR
jgi:predicted dehydrogenase